MIVLYYVSWLIGKCRGARGPRLLDAQGGPMQASLGEPGRSTRIEPALGCPISKTAPAPLWRTAGRSTFGLPSALINLLVYIA